MPAPRDPRKPHSPLARYALLPGSTSPSSMGTKVSNGASNDFGQQASKFNNALAHSYNVARASPVELLKAASATSI